MLVQVKTDKLMKAVFKTDFHGVICILKAVTHLSEKFFPLRTVTTN